MDNKFKNRYRTPSTRLENYDYSSNGYYFLTICTKDRINYFGEVKNNKLELSKTGIMTQKFWLEIPKHFSFVNLDEFVVMPNHVHEILNKFWRFYCFFAGLRIFSEYHLLALQTPAIR